MDSETTKNKPKAPPRPRVASEWDSDEDDALSVTTHRNGQPCRTTTSNQSIPLCDTSEIMAIARSSFFKPVPTRKHLAPRPTNASSATNPPRSIEKYKPNNAMRLLSDDGQPDTESSNEPSQDGRSSPSNK